MGAKVLNACQCCNNGRNIRNQKELIDPFKESQMSIQHETAQPVFDVAAEFYDFLATVEVGFFQIDKPFDVTYEALMALQTAQNNLINLMLEQKYSQLSRPFFNQSLDGPLQKLNKANWSYCVKSKNN